MENNFIDYNDNWSNGSGWLKEKVQNVGEKLGIGDGKVLGVVVNKDKNAQFEAEKQATTSGGTTNSGGTSPKKFKTQAQKDSENKAKFEEAKAKFEAGKQTEPNTGGGTPDSTKSNTVMYVGIGVGILIIGIVAIILIRRK